MAIRLSSENKGSVNMELSKTALAARYAQEAKTASESAQAAAVHPPVIGGNGNWQIWNQGSGAYVDSGICAKGPAGEQGPRGEAGNYTKPAAGIPEEDLSQAVRNKLNSGGASNYADLNNKPHINGVTLSGNKTAAQLGLAAADDVPTKTSQLQNDVGFLAQHQSLAAYRTAAAQDAIDANLMTLGLTGASVGDLVRVAAVDANGKPTSWRKAPLCEIRTNPNLLDNWYFVGGGSQRTDATGCFPINQRGLRIYSGYGYSIDRWLVGSSLQVDDGYITIPAGEYFIQNLEPALFDRLVGLAVTASILLTGNVLLSGTAVINANYDTYFYQSDYVSLYTGNGSKAFSVCSVSGLSILAVKLELGSEQTLAHQENGQWVLNEIPDYGQELAKCLRYLVAAPSQSGRRWMLLRACKITSSQIYFALPLPVQLRANPDLTKFRETFNSAITPFNSWTAQSGFVISDVFRCAGGLSITFEKANHGMTDATLQVNNNATISCEL